MARPWEYPRWRRVLMQAATWLILGGTVALAQLVVHQKERAALSLGPPLHFGALVVRVPEGWTVREEADSDETVLDAIEDGQLLRIEQFVARNPSDLRPESDDDAKRAGSTEKIQFAGLHREGQLQLVREYRATPEGTIPEEYLTAFVVVPIGQSSLVIRVELLKAGPRIGPGERALLLEVANSIRLAPARAVERRGAT